MPEPPARATGCEKLLSFTASQLFVTLIPLLPIGLEQIKTGHVGVSSLALFLAIFPTSVAGSTKTPIIFVLCMFIDIVFALLYGATSPNQIASQYIGLVTGICIIGMVVVILLSVSDRIIIHFVHGEKFANLI